MEATVKYGDISLTYAKGEDDVTSVFGGSNGELVIVRDDRITKYYNCPFTVTNDRKDKTIEA